MINRIKSSLPSIIGLTVSISVSLLILWFVGFELSFNSYHAKIDNIRRLSMKIVTGESNDRYATTGALLAPELIENYPNIDNYASFRIMDGDNKITYNDNVFVDESIYAVNKGVFEVFTHEFLEGNPERALEQPKSAVLTQTLAQKLFKDKQCLGKLIDVNNESFIVSGVIKDIPVNNDLRYDMLIHDDNNIVEEERLQSYFNLDHYTYLLISDVDNLDESLTHFGEEVFNPILKNVGVAFEVKFYASALNDLHFDEPLLMDTQKGNLDNLYVLSALAIFLLVIGISNFLNLHILNSYKKTVNVGVKRAFGVHAKQVMKEFVKDSILTVLWSILLSIILAALALNYLDLFSGIRYQPQIDGILTYVLGLILLLVVIGSLGGIIPAYTMNKWPISKLLKENTKLLSHNSLTQRLILFLQLTVSAGLIILTFELSRQTFYFNNQDPGFEKDKVLVINISNGECCNNKLAVFKRNLLSQTSIKNVSFCTSAPGDEVGKEIFYYTDEGNKSEIVHNYLGVDEDFFDVLEISIDSGRNFDRTYDSHSILVNRAFLQKFPKVKSSSTTIAQDTIKKVVGVIEDFHQLSFHNPIEPLVVGKLDPGSSYLTKMIIKMENIQSLEMVRSEWNKLNIDMSFDYYFLDDSLSKLYTKETKLLMILIVCSVITVALSGFGVFSLISVILKNRSKELAIRRVVGSSFGDNYRLFSRPFIVMLLTVFVLICPVTYYYIQIWREDYAYSLNFSVLPFLGALLLIFILIFFTLVSLLYKAYKVNITSLLRSE